MDRIKVSEFDKVVCGDLVCIVFSDNTCQPCVEMRNIIREIEKDYPKMKFCEMHRKSLGADIYTRRYQVKNVPNMLFFKNGNLVHRILGRRPEGHFRRELDQIISQVSV
jgi:thioredoxin 1